MHGLYSAPALNWCALARVTSFLHLSIQLFLISLLFEYSGSVQRCTFCLWCEGSVSVKSGMCSANQKHLATAGGRYRMYYFGMKVHCSSGHHLPPLGCVLVTHNKWSWLSGVEKLCMLQSGRAWEFLWHVTTSVYLHCNSFIKPGVCFLSVASSYAANSFFFFLWPSWKNISLAKISRKNGLTSLKTFACFQLNVSQLVWALYRQHEKHGGLLVLKQMMQSCRKLALQLKQFESTLLKRNIKKETMN